MRTEIAVEALGVVDLLVDRTGREEARVRREPRGPGRQTGAGLSEIR